MMRLPAIRLFEVIFALLLVCVFAAQVLRAWDSVDYVPTIVLALCADAILYVWIVTLNRGSLPKVKGQFEKAYDGFDELLS